MSSGGCGRTSWRGTDTVDSRFRHRPWLRRACFLEEFSQPFASLMQLGLRVSLGVSKNLSYLAVLVTLHIVKNEDLLVAFGQLVERCLNRDAVDQTS